MNSACFLVTDILKDVKSEVKRFLEYKRFDTSSEETVKFLNRLSFAPVNEFNSMKGQINALKENYVFLDPKKIKLGTRYENKYNKETGKFECVGIDEAFHYVSIIETLKMVMCNEEVSNYVKNEKESTDDIIRSFRDAESFRKNKFLKKYPHALRLLLYYDEFLTNNPLGSKTHGNKIGGLYMIIQNLPPHLRHWRGNVHVVAFCYDADVKKYGISSILEPLMFDLLKLESEYGHEVIINDQQVSLRATLVGFCGDTLAAHQVLGFLGPGANKLCRLCTITRQQLQSKSFIEGLERTEASYAADVEKVLQNPDLSTETGIREECRLNGSVSFHCIKNFILDFMHDFLEGQAAYTIKLVLAHFVISKEYNFNIEILHDRIHGFIYGITESCNKPSETFTISSLKNDKDHKLQQRSSQTWCLLRVLPFLVSDVVKEDDKYLHVILTLNKILQIIAAPKLDFFILTYLQELIKDYDYEFRELFPGADYINKLHHIPHYVKCIIQSGPMAQYSCFLCESVNRYYKEYVADNQCYKDLPQTLANISQMFACSIWGSNKKIVREKLRYSFVDNMYVENLKYKDCVLKNNFKSKDFVLKTARIKIYGNQYSENLFIILDNAQNCNSDMPVFGKIVEIFLFNEIVYFVCEEWVTQYFQESLNAYSVTAGTNVLLINSESLIDPKPFNLWHDYASEESYINLRYLLF